MAFKTKTDFAGLSTVNTGLRVRDENPNTSNEVYQPTGGNGAYLEVETYGADASPTNSYGVAADLSFSEGDITLGKVITVDGKKYALESVQIATTGGSAPTFSATSQLLEDDATDAKMCHFAVEVFSLKKRHHAQILFDAFTLTGAQCNLTSCSATIGCTINKDKLAGVIIGSDPNSGVITVTGTILQCGSAAPTVTAATGWVLTKAPVMTNPETAKPSWSFELRKILTKTEPAT